MSGRTSITHACGRAVAQLLTVLAAVAALPCGVREAEAAGTGTGLVVVVDPGLQLSCADTILFTPTAQEIAQLVTGSAVTGGDVARTSTPTSTSVSAGLGAWRVTISGLQTAAASLALTQDALSICNVRMVGVRIGSYTLSAQLTGNTVLNGPGGSVVRVTKALTRLNGSGAAYAASFSVNWITLWLSYGGEFNADFQLTFDLTNASRSGTHSSATRGTLRVTATSP